MQTITRYKLRKIKKKWLVVSTVALASVSLLTAGSSTVNADTQVMVSEQPVATQVEQSSQEVTTELDTPVEGTADEESISQKPVVPSSTPAQGEARYLEEKIENINSSSELATYQEQLNPTSVVGKPATDGTVAISKPEQTTVYPSQNENPKAEPLVQSSQEEAVLKDQDFVSDAQRVDINRILDGRSSGISSLDAAALTYEFEKARLKGATDATILAEVRKAGRVIPANLTYLSDFYDDKTGTSGTAFKDNATGKVIVAYTGTNNDGNELQDALGADIMGIGLARGQHYQPAYAFYDRLVNQYGVQNIVITGHSLGGNVAQRVAIKKNVAQTVVYNAAPLYIPAVAYLGNKVYETLRQKFDWPSNKTEAKQTIADIKNDLRHFTGNVIRITTQKDWLNNAMRLLGAVYVGEEHIIGQSGNHDLQGIADDAKQVASVKPLVSL
ncbi:YqiA/YcfP family alpha/beta fold hydrolase [Streptococcus dentapri]|uniref:YqiA/YcfP family alpha/beta fold hydrolase n=1 Tax=Streptococcus dentapri TaxID=573564 RepID=A0ABV8D3C4_9STRE